MVTINQKNAYGDAYPVINLIEIELFNAGVQIPVTELTYTASSSREFALSNCFDGILYGTNTGGICCTSSYGDSSPTVTIMSAVAVDQVVVYNRVDCCQYRIVGATITITRNGVLQWASTFVGTQDVYFFQGSST